MSFLGLIKSLQNNFRWETRPGRGSLCGRGLAAETTNPLSTCDYSRDEICHVDGRRCVCSCLSRSYPCTVYPCVKHATERAELVHLLSAGCFLRGEAARSWGECRGPAQTLPLSPKIKVWRHSPGASWGVLWEWHQVSQQVPFSASLITFDK